VAPAYPRGHLNLGIVLAAQDDNDGAARAYEAVLAIDPHHPFGNYNFARIAILQGDFARAEQLAREALRAKPEFPQALVVLSSALDSLERREEALEPLQAAVRLQPEDAGAWFNLAALLIKLNRSDAALAATERVLELTPDHASSLGMLSLLVRDHRFVPEVLEVLRAAIRADPTNLTFQSQELLLLNFDEGISADELFRRHVDFGTTTPAAGCASATCRAISTCIPRCCSSCRYSSCSTAPNSKSSAIRRPT
jgi:tetratricopeptide (TPR) repeat protein